ncbi:sugar ABC transporter ATP-binding protein [Rhizobium laguerreae]|uniref:sugar ABC transporter ATP-binding protein n=2 Tax=Rhizobium laguerreae TaxID=1076926 RepID=UPI001C8FCB81|nr:sugar ABC transporter ATP-binding protein [Rhizobium laguerreae]MBY3037086.1 sugar ABC transporter ATP-binding protein [Rhizobium laguerreae]MBY3213813.1 sugar ABC transporter ATP-binding protein [Rhizobium laguerreae]MBY3333067.1 sugar ABC transporter ATP-binding protein [Rhizobium laguerreae]
MTQTSRTAELASHPIASIAGCTRQYPGVLALDNASFSVAAGEVRALLGKNGAGKSTLIRLLTGAEIPDSGSVMIDGEELRHSGSSRAQDAFEKGVRVVYQELSLVPGMTLAENLFLGRWPRKGGVIQYADMEAEASAAMRRLGLNRAPNALVASLSPAERQLLEIARVLLGRPKLVILDEPTSSLAAAEAEKVMAAVTRIASEGIAVIYVSHRMNEIRQIAHSATIMRDGRIIDTVDVKGADTREIVRLMLGAEASKAAALDNRSQEKTVLEVRDIALAPKLTSVSFQLKAGEVLGIAGLLGSGRTELLQAIMGVRSYDHGQVLVDGQAAQPGRYKRMIAMGFAYTPESRKEEGIVPLLGVDENTLSTNFAGVSKHGTLSAKMMADATRKVIQRLHIKTAQTDTPIGTLSGGNQQKVVIGRWVYANSRVLLLDEPTRGVDVEAKAQIYAIIRQLAAEGRSVIFVSSEIEELPLVCDRVQVLRDGTLKEEFKSPKIDQDALMAACIAGH